MFDLPVQPHLANAFLSDARHHLAVALRDDRIVGMATAVHYLHPDKDNELWINEVGVADAWQGQGIGTRLIRALLAHGRSLGCAEAWVLADEDNVRAHRFYESLGGAASPARMFSFRIDPSSAG